MYICRLDRLCKLDKQVLAVSNLRIFDHFLGIFNRALFRCPALHGSCYLPI